MTHSAERLMKELFHIQWHITHLCNLRCTHCYQDDFSRERDLDRVGLQKVSDNLLNTLEEWDQTACIHLTGGEPLLKPELIPLLNDLNQSSRVEELGIITNGLLLDQAFVKKLSAIPKLKRIKISLDGSDAETNDSIRGEETFERILQNIRSIKKDSFEIIFMFTVMKRNFRDLASFFELSQDLGVDGFIVERFIPLGRGKKRLDEVMNKQEWREMINTISNLFSLEEKNSLLPYQAFQIRFKGEEPELLGAPCVLGQDGLCVMPEGEVYPCRRFPISIGNLLETSLKQILAESEIVGRLRKKNNLKGKCGSCEIKDCRGCRSLALALTGDYLAEDPHCCLPHPFPA